VQTVERAGLVILFATAFVTASQTIACQQASTEPEQTQTASQTSNETASADGTASKRTVPVTAGRGVKLPHKEQVLERCSMYDSIPSAYGFCLYKHAGGLKTIETAEEVCALAGDWQKQCRHAWVAARMQQGGAFDKQTLLDMCGENVDCSFELLDFRYEKDTLKQIELCEQYAGPYAEDCVGHAVQRWWLTEPDESAVAQMLQIQTKHANKVGYFVGASVSCNGIGTCEGDPDVASYCEHHKQFFDRKPENCPKTEMAPMHTGNDPKRANSNQTRQTQLTPATP